jgi:hypothetical protein
LCALVGGVTLTGRFDVLEATFGPNGYIERFHVGGRKVAAE